MGLAVGVLSAAVVLTCAPFSIAGPLFPCPTAVNSVHGNAIAIAHKTIEWHAGIGKPLSVQFTVMTKTDFVNDSQKISAPVTYWGDWSWEVVLDMNNQADRISYSCAVPLVTDDAQFLILLATGPVFDSVHSALRVYRKGDYSSERMQDGTVKGVLVREVKLEELWPATKIDPSQPCRSGSLEAALTSLPEPSANSQNALGHNRPHQLARWQDLKSPGPWVFRSDILVRRMVTQPRIIESPSL